MIKTNYVDNSDNTLHDQFKEIKKEQAFVRQQKESNLDVNAEDEIQLPKVFIPKHEKKQIIKTNRFT